MLNNYYEEVASIQETEKSWAQPGTTGSEEGMGEVLKECKHLIPLGMVGTSAQHLVEFAIFCEEPMRSAHHKGHVP